MTAAAPFEAEVTATFGRHVRVRDVEGTEHEARPQGRRLVIACGDRVRCARDTQHEEVRVTEVLPRRTALWRSSLRGDAELVVANISHLVAVIAPRPAPDYFVIDRYFAAAASSGIASVLVANKSDLGHEPALHAELAVYESLGATTIACTATSGDGLAGLRAVLKSATAVLVGQSGVGKSSLVNALVPGAGIETADLVRQTGEGRHTTTAARLFDLPDGGRLIDSPGVRDFSPAIDHLEPGTLGYADVAWLAPQCRFLDCRHMREPDCAVAAASGSDKISARRYESYRRMRRLFEQLTEARGPGRQRRG
ncbi:MAG: ribosome small subunit-dependent GTPase A [Steroidobacteraceae bacterium]|jgi:ribosome biogenesis GTPase|nr:ribosome small subunit-dependent GTPase A [Steroidobacteraceae bacterium]